MQTTNAVSRLAEIIICSALAFVIAFSLLPTGIAGAVQQDSPNGANSQVRIGYYNDDPLFQDGASDEDRKSGYAYEYFQEIAPYFGWVYTYAYGTRDEMLKALENGDVDIVAGVYDTDNLNGKALLSSSDMGLDGSPRYFAVAASKPELLGQLNEAVGKIHAYSPKFEIDTWEKYYASSSPKQILTEQEQQWLDNKGTLVVGYILDNLPISGQDEAGNISGVVSEVVKSMNDYLGINIETKGFRTSEETREALAAGEIDVFMPAYADPWITETRGIYQTAPFITDRVMVLFKTDSPHLLSKIAVNEEGLGQSNYIRAKYPDAQIVYCTTRDDTFKALESGEATCALGPASILTRYLAAHPEVRDLQSAYLDGVEYYAIGSRQSDPILAQILNKFVLQIDNTLMNNAMVTYSSVDPEYSLAETVRKYSPFIITFILLVLLILAFVFYKYIKNVKKFNAEQQKTREALEDALDIASNASDAKTTFLSNMSHDIRTPLNGIIGMTAIAAANIDDKSRVQDCLAKIASSGKHLLAIINEILDVSKIESGKFELTEEVFRLPDLIDDLIAINKPMSDAKNLNISLHVENVEHETVEGDRTRLQQIYTNLVSNAIKFTPENGSISILLTEKPSGSPKVGRYDFIVEDTGIGMSKEFLPTIFEAFARADDKDAVKEQGTGLGMPIALSIARMMNGDITVESKLDEGSKFTATVFLKLCEPDTVSYEDFIDLNVLVVDDDADACAYTCTLLDSLGMKSEYTLSGREAVKLVKEHYEEKKDYFAVILDWIMPDMDGLETLRAIRANVPKDIPIIIVSAYDWSEIEAEARAAGVKYFVSKPLFKSRVAHLFSQLVGMKEEAELTDLNEITNETPLAGKRALLAEDNALNAEIAMNFFNMAGMEIEHAINGKKAVEMLEASEPGYYDCVFMDIKMPIMNGHEAARAIRALDRPDAKTIPIFAMTANAFVDDIKESKSAGMNEHFAKPLDFEKIISTILGYLD